MSSDTLPSPRVVIQTSRCWVGSALSSCSLFCPADSVALPITLVSVSPGFSAGAVRISTTVPAEGESMVTSAKVTGSANEAMIPTPGLSVGNCCWYLSVFHEVLGSPSTALVARRALSAVPLTLNTCTLAAVMGWPGCGSVPPTKPGAYGYASKLKKLVPSGEPSST